MFCKNCGKEIPENANACPYCGTFLNESAGYAAQNQYGAVQNRKSKMAAGLFGIFLGAFGVHNFYLGFTGKAVAQLLITVLSCFTLSWVSEIWGLIEGILILTGDTKFDAEGKPLGE